ncbi:glutamine--fructose-6-phosphate transaminase (isomerizing) [Halonotius roseus]|uniref:Glutamine--fructose-6-phosphate aminotransferase [isomerizing] n=1 Tax=Halonotius roseus TaxID=2511997 RepID=A0A544QMZ5_9EURY|nr:glutamine--fructose-6-phosphate transaminase (isomerizing) [Halonotius roseus]TQQ80286.1 glutamine--fructose-6-phosphate transaminase (isomerizing) [Halonotius roseus]
MCGIVGYVGEDAALPVLMDGLSNLEYRGYDSAGVALVDDDVSVYKRSGEVDALRSALPAAENAPQTIGIGHTRWSTHGPPTDANAHPHTDESGRVAVVHNGIIENFETLREELGDRTFTSDTDTEVIPHLIAAELDGGATPQAAVQTAADRLAGSFAIVVAIAGVDELFAIRRDSPLVVGHGDGETYLASDVTAFLEETREVTYLEDDDMAVVGDDGVTIYRDGEPIIVETEQLEWEADAAEKGGFDHYMLKEIHEQPRALRQTLSGRFDIDAGTVDLDLDLEEAYLNSVEEIQIIACGTSNYAGRYAAELLESVTEVRTSVEVASEYEFDGGRDPWRTLVVAVTQSGETADTLSAVRKAKQAGARTLAVTNTLGSTVTREVDDSLFIRAGPEIGVAATKTFASQVATLSLFAVYLGRVRGSVSSAEATTVLESIRALPGAVQQILDDEDYIREVAEEHGDSNAFFFIGRRFGHPVSLEGALKLKEISYDHAEGFPAGELKHGPLALVTPETTVLAVVTEGSNADETLNNIKEVQARGATVIGAASAGDSTEYLDVQFSVPDIGLLEPLVTNVYWQLFAYYVAKSKGRNIDKPRNLAKSVTVE